jgi:antibiotic biosynthesis monooxygenase (ABM) superfamily enzyme
MTALSPPVQADMLGRSEYSTTGADTITGRHRCRLLQALTIWLAIYPALTLALWVFEHLSLRLALPLRTLILTAILVPTMVYVLIPVVTRALRPGVTRRLRRPRSCSR